MSDTSKNKGRRGPGRPRSEKARRAVIKSTLELLKMNNDLSIKQLPSGRSRPQSIIGGQTKRSW
jgi:hypothetical protein